MRRSLVSCDSAHLSMTPFHRLLQALAVCSETPTSSVVCKYVYDKGHIMHYLQENNTRCPVAACPAKLKSDKVKDDPLLATDIDELRKTQNQNIMTDVMDVTEFKE